MIRPPPVQCLALGPRTACDTLSISTGMFLAESHHNEAEEVNDILITILAIMHFPGLEKILANKVTCVYVDEFDGSMLTSEMLKRVLVKFISK